MVCTADDLLGWKDFPKGLRVLLLDEDSNSAAQIKSKLEEMDYIVSTFFNQNEALMEISRKPESFHVAIVEVDASNGDRSLKFLETAKDLPIIMTSKSDCLSTMMKCIALGAAEFLQKPLSEEKLKNIWQHVVHKAFNAGEGAVSKSLKPVKETVASMVSIQQERCKVENHNFVELENLMCAHECDADQSTVSDKFSAPSTPQLKQGSRFLDDGDCQDQPNCSIGKENKEQEEESKSVEITCNNSAVESTGKNSFAQVSVKLDQSLISKEEAVIKDEDSLEGSKTVSNYKFQNPENKERMVDSPSSEVENLKKASSSLHPNSCGSRANKKKVDWTPDLHKRFVQVVDQLGIDQAIPSRILELMKVEGLTRHNVASHLQKYRMHRRHIMPREEDQRWQRHQHPRDHLRRVYPHKPIMAYPPLYHPNHAIPTGHFYPVWGHPSSHLGFQMWGHPGYYPSWQPTEHWPWKTHPGTYVDAWGCPVMPPSHVPNASGFHNFGNVEDTPKSSFDLYPAQEVIDEVVKEAISKPWLPLPLGLKPPSTESVLSELHRQGICPVPPHSHHTSH